MVLRANTHSRTPEKLHEHNATLNTGLVVGYYVHFVAIRNFRSLYSRDGR